jgi:hypothetical protein
MEDVRGGTACRLGDIRKSIIASESFDDLPGRLLYPRISIGNKAPEEESISRLNLCPLVRDRISPPA